MFLIRDLKSILIVQPCYTEVASSYMLLGFDIRTYELSIPKLFLPGIGAKICSK